MRRPPIDGRGSAQQQKLLLAIVVILLPWLQLADAQQQQAARVVLSHEEPAGAWQATPIKGGEPATLETLDDDSKWPKAEHPEQVRRSSNKKRSNVDAPAVNAATRKAKTKTQKETNNFVTIPDDASAVATLAPPPHSPRHLQHSSAASGLASPQIARSLEDWEVEDFVLLATVDGDLYASDRKTGKELWHLEVDQPMVETTHYRGNNSVLDEDYNPLDHYIWAVEPNRDGDVYVWVPEPDSPPRRTGFTMKRLVEEMSPYYSEEPPVVYTGDKKTTMVTLDAATGHVLKWFGSSGSHVNEAESCLKPNGLYDQEAKECSSTGTITLGRTEYTVGIQRADGKPIATLKYAEWGPNNRDQDLLSHYQVSLDSRYITSQHDGKVYAFDYARQDKMSPLFSHKFAAPVARVFDVCRPWDAAIDSNPDLVALPQPTMPWQDSHTARIRENSIFLNQTEQGSWYALSGRAYPLIIGAPEAKVSQPEWWDTSTPWESLSDVKVSKALVGTHRLEAAAPGRHRNLPTLPESSLSQKEEGPENESMVPKPVEPEDESTILTKVKSIPKGAANSALDFISNPIVIILFIVTLVYNEKKLRRSYQRFRDGSSLKETVLHLAAELPESPKETKPDNMPTDEIHPEDKNQVNEPELSAAKVQSNSESALTETKSDETEATKAEAAEDKEAKPDESQDKPKKPRKRGQRGGKNHRKQKNRENSQSQDDGVATPTVEEVLRNAEKLGDKPGLEPDTITVANDMQGVGGSIIRMGNIEVNTDEQLGSGSNGTLVFAGKFDGREVAVKRMLIQFYDIASQETRLLRESDDHKNVIRYYSQQIRDGFLYIALERCAASLAEVVERPHAYRELANAGKLNLPSVLYQIANGIGHLHSLRIVHRDLKPQNILVNMGKEGRPIMLVSDFGLCKKLEGGQSSFGATTGRAAGTSGWRAPELLLDDDGKEVALAPAEASIQSGSGSVLVNDGTAPHSRRATRAIDIFSLGLVYYYVLTNGSHPFDCGAKYMREVNIRKGNYNLEGLDSLGDFAYEAKDLVASMLEADPRRRPNCTEVKSHPFFWSAKKRLAFLCDVSDHFEKEPRDPPSEALQELERHAPEVTRGDFLKALTREFVDSLGKQRKYTGSRLLDLLRALRNKRNHYEDMTESLKRSVGPLPEGYLSFWTLRFPMLLLVCWNVVYNVRWEETDRFKEYYEPAEPAW